MVILLALTLLPIAIFGAYPMIRQKYWKELIVYEAFLLLDLILSILLILGVELPYIADLITHLFKKFFGI